MRRFIANRIADFRYWSWVVNCKLHGLNPATENLDELERAYAIWGVHPDWLDHLLVKIQNRLWGRYSPAKLERMLADEDEENHVIDLRALELEEG
jgi:hypothetical protein